jgi:uncharacterized protein YkwD
MQVMAPFACRIGSTFRKQLAMLTTAVFAAMVAGQAIAQGIRKQESTELLQRLNAYRAQNGLERIPTSPAMTAVAEAHVLALEANPPTGVCNGHSWPSSKLWKECCYTDDHAKAQCMWDKPKEITAGRYQGAGFEIWAWRSGQMTLEFAIEGWKSSAPHNDVLVNKGPWAKITWRAAGAAVSQRYAVVWFGMDSDPDSPR